MKIYHSYKLIKKLNMYNDNNFVQNYLLPFTEISSSILIDLL